MKLENLNLTELNAKELKDIEGGYWKDILEMEASIVDWFIRNKESRFVKNTFAGKDPYYP